MAAAQSAAMSAGIFQNGLEFLLDPVDRFPLTEVTADVERPDPLVLMDVRRSAPATADSSCAVVVGNLGGSSEQNRTGSKRKCSPTQSAESTGKVTSEAPGWTRRLRLGRAPPNRKPFAGRVTPLEETIRRYADKPTENVVKPEIGMSFDSLGEAYDFYNLYSWELGFGIRYGKSRLNAEKTKCMQKIVCGCSGKPEQQNSRSCRCECPAMIGLLKAADNGWYIAEHRASHNHSLSLTCGEKVHWPSHKHIDVYTKHLVKQLRANNVNLNKVYSIVGSFFGSSQSVPFTKRSLRHLCGRISRDQADDDVNKTLAVFKEIQRNYPEFTYRVQGDEESRIKKSNVDE
ncbi:protein FAR-RED IMPAIRED RESPONSE 1-like isoform X3 [Triticum dicoccoides]|uniref:protein FAR-RED IMPAIRED RESPONSE 1-like isoform X3 n=1 Tax=Triticum dicoccoides TaxID=85692 RepID=UPI000E79FEC2|nr:protein FAR-RED IMPAIRED RESPONSE 1-like isoform X3 [Triticum dicoccoides]